MLITTLSFTLACSNDDGTNENTETNTVVENNEAVNTETNQTQTVTEEQLAVSSETTNSNEAFSYLSKIDIGANVQLKYNADISTVYNQECRTLSTSDPLYATEEEGANVKLVKTKINASGSEYVVVFSSGPSADPEFMFYKDGDFSQAAFSISALHVVVTGNGSIYSSGHTNNMFNNRRKFKVNNNKLVEVQQAHYYVGLKTKTLKAITIYGSERLSSPIANLPKDYNIEVLLNKRNTSLYLIKTDFGLAGWVKLENQMYGNNAIDKLFYAGD